MSEDALWIELGKAVRNDELGMLPEEEERQPTEAQTGRWFFQRQLPNIRQIYCSENVARLVRDEKRRDVTEFVAILIDLFAAYFGAPAGTVILVLIYKIGVDQFCGEDIKMA